MIQGWLHSHPLWIARNISSFIFLKIKCNLIPDLRSPESPGNAAYRYSFTRLSLPVTPVSEAPRDLWGCLGTSTKLGFVWLSWTAAVSLLLPVCSRAWESFPALDLDTPSYAAVPLTSRPLPVVVLEYLSDLLSPLPALRICLLLSSPSSQLALSLPLTLTPSLISTIPTVLPQWA